jgi:ribosome-associated protein
MTTDITKRVTKRGLPLEVRASVKAGQEKMGQDILVLDLRDIASFADFFIILHGNSGRQNQAICDNIERELRKENLKPMGLEGRAAGDWILMDYGRFIVHVFSKEKRDYYALEKLWGDAPKFSY